MNGVFNAYYFDGITALAQNVSVSFSHQNIQLIAPERNINRLIHVSEIGLVQYISRDRILISIKTHDGEQLEILHPNIAAEFNTAFPGISKPSILLRVNDSGRKGLLLLLAIFLGAVAALYFLVVPMVGSLGAKWVSKDYERELGATLYGNMIQTYKIDSSATRVLGKVVENVDFQTSYPLQIVVVDFEEKNAFALPGGYIIVFSGLLKQMDAYPQLVALLAHEVSHVNHRHSLKAIFRSLSTSLFLSVVVGDVGGMTNVLLNNLNSFKELSFSRKLEREADEEGLRILFHNKIDPMGMVQLFEILMEESKIPGAMEFVSSHPLSEKRIRYIGDIIEETEHLVATHPVLDSCWSQLKTLR